MGEDDKPTIEIDDVKYDIDSMTDQQKTIVNHVMDLGQKLNVARFNVDQLQVSRQAFVDMLKASLEDK